VNWPALVALAAGTYLIRLTGLVLGDRLVLHPTVSRLLDLAATALLAALCAVAAFTEAGEFAGWARTAGVSAGAVAAICRAPFVVVVLLAAGITAALRAFGVP
jgi:branched-subunit amino acid transport protein